MATPTPNLGLVKPDMSDEVDQSIPSMATNFGVIDAATGKLSDLTTINKSSLVAAISENSSGLTTLKADVTQRAINVLSPPAGLAAAKGDGVTNDSTAIQAIINYATTAGAIIIFPPGTYVIGTTITLKNYVTIQGSGAQTTTFKFIGSNSSDCFGYYAPGGASARYIRLRDFMIQNNSTDGSAISNRGIYVSKFIERCSIENVIIVGNNKFQHGILLDSSWNTLIRNCYVSTVTVNGYHLQNNTNSIMFDHNVAVSLGQVGLYATDSGGLTVIGGDFESCGYAGIQFLGVRGALVSGSWFENNTSFDMIISKSGSQNSMGVDIHGNLCSGNNTTGWGIYVDWCNGASIVGNLSQLHTSWDMGFTVNTTNGFLAGNQATKIYNDGKAEIVYPKATAAPTTGTYKQSDYVKNSTPTELGTAGSKYVIRGFICVADGTPGTWVQDRGLTGN